MLFSRIFSIHLILPIFIGVVVVVDRFCFALISQWREDQGTNIYLGLHFFDLSTPVGLISSIGVPNPNGMLVIGSLLALLPGLIAVSAMLGAIQALAISLWLFTLRVVEKDYWLAVAFPILASLVLRADGAEFWNNVVYITLNVIFLLTLNLIWKYRHPSLVTVAVMLILFAPSMYLAGLANAAAYFLLLVLLLFVMNLNSHTRLKKYTTLDIAILILGIFFVVYVVWIPYLTSVPLESLRGTSDQNLWLRLKESLEVIYSVPVWLFRFTNVRFPIFYDSHNLALSWLTISLTNLAALILKAQFVFFVVMAMLKLKKEGLRAQFKLGSLTYLNPFLLIALVYFFTPLMGGPNLHEGDRAEMTHQLYPMFLFTIFSGTYLFSRGLGAIARRISLYGACSYALFSVLSGALFFVNVLNYSSPILNMPDVPLRDKVAAVKFVADSWKAESPSQNVQVDYDLAGPWTWIPEFGKKMLPYYSPVFTVGRALDYEFERVYNLRNYQEGIQMRSIDSAKYVIAYSDNCRNFSLKNIDVKYFGSVCVKIKYGE